jgi:hypothetical protein
VSLARQQDLLAEANDLAAVDSTGLESRHVSTYFGRRSGRKYHRFPKVSQVIDTRSHLALAAVVDRGPKPDDIEFHPVVRQGHDRHPFAALAGDVGYDGEHHHRFLHRLGVLGIIPPRRGRPAHSPTHRPASFFRGFWHDHWPRVQHLYGQRWQVESRFSMEKRLLDSCLTARRRPAQDREAALRVLTLNLMILGHDP